MTNTEIIYIEVGRRVELSLPALQRQAVVSLSVTRQKCSAKGYMRQVCAPISMTELVSHLKTVMFLLISNLTRTSRFRLMIFLAV